MEMEALTSSSSKLFSSLAERNRNRVLSSSCRALCTPHQIRFFSSQKPNLSHWVSLQFKAIESTSSSSFSSDTKTDVGTEEAVAPATSQSRNVHVKFQLHKDCWFGEQFLLVGDDPILGLWDPANAIPLDWSDGHIWTVELDIPIGKSIQFKFILKGPTGKILWQPDPDRILQTWETENTIIVSEDWEDVKGQKITEEGPMPNPNNEPMLSSNVELIVAQNNTYPKEEPMVYTNKKPLVAENITCPIVEPMDDKKKELTFTENITCLKQEPKANSNKEAMVTENKICLIVEPKADQKGEMIVADKIFESNDIAVTDKKPMCIKDDDCLLNYEGEPVLVPGLTLLPTITIRDTVLDASTEAEEAEDQNMPEKHEKQEPDGNLHLGETTMMMVDEGPKKEQPVNGHEEKPPLAEGQQQTDCQTTDDNDFHSDIQWGRKTLRKLLMNLGFIQLN